MICFDFIKSNDSSLLTVGEEQDKLHVTHYFPSIQISIEALYFDWASKFSALLPAIHHLIIEKPCQIKKDTSILLVQLQRMGAEMWLREGSIKEVAGDTG